MKNGKLKIERWRFRQRLAGLAEWCGKPLSTCITDLLQTQRHPEIVQPLLALLVVGHHGENRIPKLAGVLRVFQMGQFVNNQVVNDHRLGHDALPMEGDIVTLCASWLQNNSFKPL